MGIIASVLFVLSTGLAIKLMYDVVAPCELCVQAVTAELSEDQATTL
jgi:hypothetical protein